jgi:flagellar motor switch protein FliN/FliY
MDPGQPTSNDDIERLLAEAGAGLPPANVAPAPAAATPAAAAAETPNEAQPAGAAQAGAAQAGAAQAGAAAAAAAGPAAPATGTATKPAAPTAPRDEPIASADIELLLKQAQDAIASIDQPHLSPAAAVKSFQLDEFSGAPPNTERATLELIRDVELDLRIEFGRTHMYLEDVLKLRKGSVVPLDKLAGDPVDIFVNGRLIAKGEVLVLNDNFCVRVAELIAGEQPA